MLIRNQSRETLINFQNIGSISVEGCSGDDEFMFVDTKNPDKFAVFAIMAAKKSLITLGRYDTEERAIKVLDEIQGACQHNVAVFQMPAE